MKAVIQRVKNASVTIDGKMNGKIEKGLLVLLGIQKDDSENDAKYLAEKIINLRIFEDAEKKMNLSLLDVRGSLLIISQFTLYGDCQKGRRPSFDKAMPPDNAEKLYKFFVSTVQGAGVHVETGIFGAMMDVDLVNYGPVTFIIDSK